MEKSWRLICDGERVLDGVLSGDRTRIRLVGRTQRATGCLPEDRCESFMARYRFWFYDRDKKGQPLDPTILKAAEKIAPKLTRYRQKEIDGESTANDILQTAVEAASSAISRRSIENPASYLASIYKHFVDKFLGRRKQLIPVGDDFLESLANSEKVPSFEEWIHNRLTLEKLLRLMNAETRRICCWRLEGYSESEIATRLGSTPNAVSVRFTRGLKEAEKLLLAGKRRPQGNDV